MRSITLARAALTAACLLAAGAAGATNICQAEKLTCPTTMPVGGFCECTAHGQTKDGTAVPKQAPHDKVNSTGAGCGTNATAPGCR